MEVIGQRIRNERQRRRFTLEQLSQKSGLSKSHLSQIERGLAQPSVSTLKKISKIFGVSVVELFDESFDSQGTSASLNPTSAGSPVGGSTGPSNYSQEVRVVRSDRRKALKLPGSSIHYDLLTPDLNRQLEVLAVTAAPGEHTGNEPINDSSGDKFGLVLKGRLEVTVKDEVFLLEEGDAIYHPAGFAHSWRCVGDESVEIIWVMTPPSF